MSLINTIYDATIREHLPKKIASYNGVAVRNPRLFDNRDRVSDMKYGLIREVRKEVDRGDDVVDIGTGFGLAATWAARESRTGQIDTYDASAKQVETASETIRLNGVDDRITVHHALVGEEVKVDNELGDPDALTGNEIPDCDVLVMDCEGAELAVLPEVADAAGTYIVESHGHLGAQSDDVVSQLSNICDCVEVRGDSGIDSEGRDNKVIVGTKQ